MENGKDLFAPPTKDPKPTEARPGTEEKIQVFHERLVNHERLFHPKDNRDCGKIKRG